VADGMYFVGIDVIGDKVVEINAESPGGMQSVEKALRDRRLPNCHGGTGAPRRLKVLSHWVITSRSRVHLSSGLLGGVGRHLALRHLAAGAALAFFRILRLVTLYR
jgi:hypothetical protein